MLAPSGVAALAIMPILLWLHYRNYHKTVRPARGEVDLARTVLVLLLCGLVFIGSAHEGEWLVATLVTAFILFIAWTCGGFHTPRPQPKS